MCGRTGLDITPVPPSSAFGGGGEEATGREGLMPRAGGSDVAVLPCQKATLLTLR